MKQKSQLKSMATVLPTDPWDVVKTVSAVLFGDKFDTDINNIQKEFQLTANDITDLLDSSASAHKSQENTSQNKTILYQLLLTVFKDTNTNISNILQAFIAITPNHASTRNQPSTFNACTPRHMVYMLITHVFNALSNDITPYMQNKMIQYFVVNDITGHKFSNMKRNVFVNDLADEVPTDILQIVHQTILSFKDQSVFECRTCYRIYVTTECKDNALKSNNIRCVGCNTFVSTEYKTEPSSTHAYAHVEDLGSKIVKLFDSRSGKPLDDAVFPSLVSLLQRDPEGLIKMKRDNYCTRLKDKDYDMIIKSLIVFISTICCDNPSCETCDQMQSIYVCPCDSCATFKAFMYALVLSINGLKSSNDASLIQK
eukprot:294579_1